MDIFLLSAAIAAVAMLVISRPLFTQAAAVEEHALPDAQQTRKEALEALNELEYDYRMNKISKEDYEAMTLPYKQLIMQHMQTEQRAVPKQTAAAGELQRALEEEIEQELQARLKGRTTT